MLSLHGFLFPNISIIWWVFPFKVSGCSLLRYMNILGIKIPFRGGSLCISSVFTSSSSDSEASPETTAPLGGTDVLLVYGS